LDKEGLEIDLEKRMGNKKCIVLKGSCKGMGTNFGRLIEKELMENTLHLNRTFGSQ
jgi:hypothetical protein